MTRLKIYEVVLTRGPLYITDGVELFNQFGDAEVKFEVVKN